ncbi:MAG: extracellular solute-binding protein [Oscillospiraceae bacterium]|nr:extracellular solute-binding protein [Oscillospiraceae bacterium]
MKKKIRFLPLLTALLLLLSACGKRAPGSGAASRESAPAEARYLRYDVSEERLFDLSYEDHDFGETELVLLGARKNGSRVLRVPLDGGEPAELLPDKLYRQVAAGKDCLWLGLQTELTRLDLSGQETLSLTLPEKIEDLLCDDSGRLYAAHRNSLTLVGDTGETESIPLPEGFTGGSLCRLGSGDPAVFASRVKGAAARLQRITGGSLRPVEIGDASIGLLAAGDAAADFYYLGFTYQGLLSEAGQVFRCSGGRSAPVFDLAGAGREGKVRGLCPAGGDFLLLYGGEEGSGLLRFQATEAEKKVLTVARLNNNHNITELIARFNRENPDYYLIGRHYYGTDTEAQLEQLELDVLSGDRPDLLDTMCTSLEVFGAKGLLRDLYPMIDADPTMRREDFMPTVLHAMEAESGALYQLWPVFTLWSCAEPKTYVGDAERWTLEDLYRVCEENPELTLYGNWGPFDQTLGFVLPGVMDRFADFETGDLRFDSPDFVEFLTFMQEMYRRAGAFTGGDPLLVVCHFDSAADYARGVTEGLEAGLQFTGFPCSGGTGQLCESPYSFSVFEGTGNEEDAWAFIRWFLSEEVQESLENGAPLRRSVFEAQLAAVENGTPETTVTRYVDPYATSAGDSADTVTYTLPAVPPLSEEAIAVIRRMLDGVEGVYADRAIHPFYYIVTAECTKLFAGAKTPEETARAIQERLGIYVSERTP